MKISEFDYPLPRSLVAQYPVSERARSRLMVVFRSSGKIEHRSFPDLLDYVDQGDLLVVNNSRVIPVRLIGKRETGGRCEVLLIPPQNGARAGWNALLKDAKKVKPGTRIEFGEEFYGEVEELRGARAKIRFPNGVQVMEQIRKVGHMPLPPYIRREDEPIDRERYQTIFAQEDGSIACPTAGLHFSPAIMESLKAKGVKTAAITLHVGVGTFLPLRSEEIEDHSLDPEWVEISEEAREAIEEARQRGGRVIAVGTTTTRALESFALPQGRIKSGRGQTDLFIYPPYTFRVIDGLITNFHLPKSTLLLLASAFAGKDLLMRAYKEAVARSYRFYSYGDAMLIL